LSEIDQKSADLAADQRDLDQILQASVPGLVSKNQRRSGISHNTTATTTDGPVAGHKLLVEPNVFNVSSLLPPSLSFLQRLKDIVPHDSDIAMSTLTSFLDEFLVNIFQPQLEETVTELCTQSFVELDAFQKDSQWSQRSAKPIFKVTVQSSKLRLLLLTFVGHLQFLRFDKIVL
jgi:exocyst complex component 4